MQEIKTIVLKGAHVIDPQLGLDGLANVLITDGKIVSIGERDRWSDVDAIDLSGCYLSPGWIDLHVHAYGALGFSNPDMIGIYQGVTTFVDAGGPGIDVLDQFASLARRLQTSLYAGAFIRPIGLLGLNVIEDVRSIGNVPVAKWLDYAKQNRDMLRYIKCNAMGDYGPGTLKIAKGLAEILNLPLYMHIGEFKLQTPDHLLAPEAFRIAAPGDMITHLYHGNLGRVLDEQGKVLGVVRDAQRRGVLFDIGFGGYNFSWDVAEKAFAQDLIPHTISSDLQQYNVMRPVKSLANVMSAMMRLGFNLRETIERVTFAPAKALSLTDRAGTLKPGMPADITIFRINHGEFQLDDCFNRSRVAEKMVVPVMTFKNGERFEANVELAQDESNWFFQFAEDHVPAQARMLSEHQRSFLGLLGAELSLFEWEIASNEYVDIEKAGELQNVFHVVRERCGSSLDDALLAVYASFMDQRFTPQIGLLFLRLDKDFVSRRLTEVSTQRFAT